MGVTALVAVCVAIGRVFLAGGVLLFLLFGFSTVRVALLAQQRYRYGYPVSNRDLGRWFGVSVVGLIGGGLAFGLTCLLGTMGLGVAGSVLPGRGVDRIFLVGMLVTVMNAAAVAWATRLPPEQRRLAWLGAGTGGFSAGLVVLALRTLTPVFAPLIMLPLLSGSAGLFYLTCIPGPVRRLMAYSIGFFTATSAWGWCGYLSPQGFPVQDMERSLLFLGLFLPPTLLTLLVMSGIWSWDDAFPETRATAANTPDRPHPAGILLMESAEGIEFLGDSDRLAEAGPKPPGPEQTSASEPPRQREETD